MTIEVSAKKIDDAIKQGLAQLGAELDQVNVEVIESGGLFRKAKVRLTLEDKAETTEKDKNAEKKSDGKKPAVAAEKKPSTAPVAEKSAVADEKTDVPKKQENAKSEKPVKPVREKEKAPAEKSKTDGVPVKTEDGSKNGESKKAAMEQALTFVKEVVVKMGFEGVDAVLDGDTIRLTAPTGDDSLIIGRHGETLSALSFLAETLGRAEKHHVAITVDCNGYRARRADSLTAMAKRRANECVQKRRKIKLEAMERIDRRTIHNALTDDERVTTASEGKEPYRYVVIYPKKASE